MKEEVKREKLQRNNEDNDNENNGDKGNNGNNENLALYKALVTWSMVQFERLLNLIFGLLEKLRRIWSWIRSKIGDLVTKIKKLASYIAEAFNDWCNGEGGSTGLILL